MAKSILCYGESGAFKTTQIKWLARYIYEKYGKITRLFSCDLGGWEPCNPEIEAGIIQAFRVRRDSNPLPQIRLLSKGYWPELINGKIAFKEPNADTWKNVGAIVAESLTSVGDLAMEDVVNKGRQIAEEVVGLYTEDIDLVTADGKSSKVGGEKFGASGRAHYNFAQKQIYGLISNMSALPCELVMFTALESKGEDSDRSTIYGPSAPGKALVPKIPSLVGDCIHFDTFQVENEVDDIDPTTGKPKMADSKPPKVKKIKIYSTKVRAYFVKHPDPKFPTISFPAKPRLTPQQTPELLKKFPGGYFEPTLTSGLDMYLKALDELGGNEADKLKEWRAEMDRKMGRGPTGTTAATPNLPVAVASSTPAGNGTLK